MGEDEIQSWLQGAFEREQMNDQTRPVELSRSEAKKLAEEMAEVIGLAADERKYREHVLTTLARMEVKFDHMSLAFSAHEKLDNERHTTVTQKIGDHSGWINKALGMAALFVFMIGVIFFVIERSSK